jgi:predicted dehydrogenase
MMVAENYRYQSLYRHAAELIGNHAIGKPYAAVWNIFHRITEDNPYAATAWRIKHRYPGGFLTDGGVHNMAVLRSLVGDITSVSGFASQVNPAIGKLDTLSFDFKSERDVRGTFTLFVSAVGYEKNQLLVFGTDGTMIVEDGTVTLRRPGKSDVVDVLKEDDGFTEEFLDFFNAIRTGTKVRGTFLEAYRDLRVILTALESAQSGKRKKLPTKP